MTTQDNELFDLCKQVYEATGWDDKNAKNRFIVREVTDLDLAERGGNTAPVYTSDYLLEKLPRQIMSKPIELYGYDEETATYLARYDVMDIIPSNQGWYGARADTPLKALLKLTIALHEAGELI